MTRLNELNQAGQSVWLDYIRRAYIASGELQAIIEAGVTGITSNPSIFEKAIAGSSDYDADIQRLVMTGRGTTGIYEALALDDIGRAADLLRPVYERTAGRDGYVSLEVSPELAHDTAGTIADARRLFAALGRPNVMIKVPATPAGIPAFQTLISEGINVNVTLMFSLAHYEAVAEAYLRGLEARAAAGGDLSRVASVASFFVSRVDSAVDKALAAAGNQQLPGKIAVANAKITYQRFQAIFTGPRWQKLAQAGAQPQRVLWASTSTKNPAYSDTLYVDELIGPHTVNTMPLNTVDAFLDHGTVAETLTAGLDEAQAQLAQLAELGIDLAAITEQLQVAGVDAFATAFRGMLDSVARKRAQIAAAGSPIQAQLGAYQAAVDQALAQMAAADVLKRIEQRDYTVWRDDPAEIRNRLGWLDAPAGMGTTVPRLQALRQTLLAEGYSDVLLLGMGGSSLAPEVFYNIFGGDPAGLRLAVLDSTDPGAVLAQAARLNPATTLFIVATKSGGTVETFSFFKYFYNWTVDALGAEAAGAHFVAITDPGSKLQAVAGQLQFRDTFLADPNVGGRYSALTFFGLLPAALVGVDVAQLLDRAQAVRKDDGATLGAILGALAKAGRDKVTFVTSPALANFGDWVEQLIAESTGKDGTGILPVVGEALGDPAVYGADRLFVYLRLAGADAAQGAHDAALAALAAAGHPVVTIRLHDLYDVGGQFFLWELATAVAGHLLGIQPFDQPNVESAKVLARQMVAAYHELGRLPEDTPAPLSSTALRAFLAASRPGDYIALQAYVPPTPATTAALNALRLALRDRLHLATTVGYGPRFLHSTGQLHKGDGNNGLFIQFTADVLQDAPIPDEAGAAASGMSFGVLIQAQALGDGQALRDAGRRVIRFHLGTDVVGGLERLFGG
ncbi:MAG: bifunctional transaldolase/phosoglucose isomerase [Ardenticatenaceae bacterium]|nr:bifunctional transaldolase/phosoglucose isomerase [Ardenticatenaceae bacterium]